MHHQASPRRLTSGLVLAGALLAAPGLALAQSGAAPPPGSGYAPPTGGQPAPSGYAPPTGGQPAPRSNLPPPPTQQPPSGWAPATTAGDAAPPAPAPAPPPVYAPGYAPLPPPADTPPPPGYGPGYAPPAYPPPRGYSPPGYYPPGYAPPGYAPPGYAPPGYAPPGYAPPGYAPPGYAPTRVPPPPENIHDGFYLRLHIGGGYTRVSGADAGGNSLRASGGSVSFGLALGGAIAPNLIVFGNLFYSSAAAPDVTIGGVGAGLSNASLLVVGIGPGIAYYLEPINLYLSGTVALVGSELDDQNGNVISQSKAGIGVQAIVGKEWWVSQNWGLGLAGEIVAGSMTDKNDSNITWTATTASLVFSATYN